MSNSQGFFSLVQYSEQPESEEYINIGVILFLEGEPNIMSRFVKNPRRIESVFNVSVGAHFGRIVDSIRDRLLIEFDGGLNREKINKFIALRTGNIRLSAVKSTFVVSPEQAIDELFSELVTEVNSQSQRPRIASVLKTKFIELGVETLLDKPDNVMLPQGVTVKAPYGYQNGAYNMINPLSLSREPDKAIDSASTQAANGNWLYEAHQEGDKKRLVVVADVEGQKAEFVDAVSVMMRRNNVKFYRMDDMNNLIDDIKANTL